MRTAGPACSSAPVIQAGPWSCTASSRAITSGSHTATPEGPAQLARWVLCPGISAFGTAGFEPTTSSSRTKIGSTCGKPHCYLMHQHKPVLGKDGNPVRPCEGLWDRATHEALRKVILHRMAPWALNSNREHLLTKIALCGQCHTRLYGAPDQPDLAAAAAQPRSVFPRLGSDTRSEAGGAGSRVTRDRSAPRGHRLALRAWGFPPTLYLDVPDEVSVQVVARFLSGREGDVHLRVPSGGASAPQPARQGRQVAWRRPTPEHRCSASEFAPAHPVTSGAAGDYGANEQSDNVVS
ncbi:hypothetical protein SATRM34S_06203 [Streptomyces atroolivaceus]